MERDDSDSIVVAATNFVGMLDEALFRRFDDVIMYEFPNAKMIESLIKNRLSSFDVAELKWKRVTTAAKGLSHADVTRACDDAAKEAVLAESRLITTQNLTKSLLSRTRMHRSRSPRKRTK
jgi:AAA+ superfamily predicted ATPase